MMQRWHKTQNTKLLQQRHWRRQSLAVDSGGKWRFDGVSNESTTCQEWQEASSNVAGHSRCPFPLSISLCPPLSFSLPANLKFLWVVRFSVLRTLWVNLHGLTFLLLCASSRCVLCLSLSHSSFLLSLSLSSYLHDEPLQNTSINYFLLDHPQSLCISAVARSTPPPSSSSFSSSFISFLSHLSRRFSLPLANCVNQFDQLTDSQRAPLWQTLIAPQQRQQQPRLGLWLQLIGTVALASLLSLALFLTSPPPVSLSLSLSLPSVFLFDSLWQSTFIWTLPFRVLVTNFAIHVEHRAQFSPLPRPVFPSLNAIYNISSPFGFRSVQQPQLSKKKNAPLVNCAQFIMRALKAFVAIGRGNCRPTGGHDSWTASRTDLAGWMVRTRSLFIIPQQEAVRQKGCLKCAACAI